VSARTGEGGEGTGVEVGEYELFFLQSELMNNSNVKRNIPEFLAKNFIRSN
jgi:hypothetical protein